jgi:hypothetical protein
MKIKRKETMQNKERERKNQKNMKTKERGKG